MPADPGKDAELWRRSVRGESSDEIAKVMGLTKYYVVGRLYSLRLMGEPRPRLCVDNARPD